MKRPRSLVGFATLLAVLGLATGIATAATGSSVRVGKEIDPALVKKLKDNARGSVAISTDKSTKFASFIKVGQNGDLLPSEKTKSPEGKARGFFKEYGGLLGIENAQTELVKSATRKEKGATHLTYEQVYKGVPVFGGLVRVHLDADNDLTAINGVFVPELDLDTSPRFSAAQAAERAIATVVSDPPTDNLGNEASTDGLTAASTELLVYRVGLVRGATGTNELVYQVEVTNGRNVRDIVFVNAQVGKVVNRYSMVHDALFRRLFEQNTGNQVWQEGQPFPGSLNQDQQNIVNFSGHSYRYFFNAFGRDSYDALGAELRSVNNDPTIACPNANWNGVTTNYCNGVTADDVVAHEWGHAYTQFTHNLIYQWQPGALNESYSDIWGETVDMLNGVGTDAPAPVRSVGACSTHTGNPSVVINSPGSIARICPGGRAAFGPAVDETGTTGDVVLADPALGCTAFANAAAVLGKVALVDRGVCGFAVKVKNAQNAGAIAVVVANNVDAVAGMGGADATITIPSLLISLSNGNAIKGELALGSTVNVTLKEVPVSGAEDSYRWLRVRTRPPSAGRSATCGLRPASATRAR